MPEQVIIERRFCGPPDSANGGYACGTVAELVGGTSATVRLRKPPPLDRPIDVERADGEVRLLDDGELVATGRPSDPPAVEPPYLPAIEVARDSTLRVAISDHAYSTCFVCGPAREPPDGLGIFAGPVLGREDGLIATTWAPDAGLASNGENVDDIFVWSALDCPTGNVAFYHWQDTLFLLGELTASLEAPVEVGTEHVVVAWPIEQDGRRYHTAMAITNAAGRILARSKAIWISV